MGYLDDLVDLASGRLSPEESLERFAELERDKDASTRLETIIDLMHLSSEKQDNVFEKRNQAKESRWRSMLWRLEKSFRLRPVLYPLVGLLLILVGFELTFVFKIGRAHV